MSKSQEVLNGLINYLHHIIPVNFPTNKLLFATYGQCVPI